MLISYLKLFPMWLMQFKKGNPYCSNDHNCDHTAISSCFESDGMGLTELPYIPNYLSHLLSFLIVFLCVLLHSQMQFSPLCDTDIEENPG